MKTEPERHERSDLDLIAAINSGDSGSFEVLYWRYREWVLRLAIRFTGDEDAALDVLQETFLYVLKKFPGFCLSCEFKSFLYPAVRNLAIGARRKAARYQPGGEEAAEAIDPQHGGDASVLAGSDLHYVLSGLPEEHREVLLLRFVDGLSLAEIAIAMDIPLGTVKSRLHNALRTLREDPRTTKFFGR